MAMRKKEIHAAKVALMRRVKAVCLMTDEQLREEAGKLYPGMKIEGGSDLELVQVVINAAIDNALPDSKVLF